MSMSREDGQFDHKGQRIAGCSRVIWLICIAAVLLASTLRFYHLETKNLVPDETDSMLQIGGYVQEDSLNRIYDRYLPASGVLKYSPFRPGSTVFDTFDCCRLQTSYNPPLYFVLARLWCQEFGLDIISLRRFSAMISLLEIPCFFFLYLELFESASMAAIVTALSMVSPYHLQLAQYPRPYALWAVLTLLSSLLLVKAAKHRNAGLWVAYVAASTLNLYTHISALRVLCSHLFYCCFEKICDRRYRFLPALGSILIALMLFVPWVIEINNHLYSYIRGIQWFIGNTPMSHLYAIWFNQANEVFLDVGYLFPSAQKFCSPLVGLLMCAAILAFIRIAPRSSRLFLVTMLVTTFLTLAIPDLIWGAGRTKGTRYMMPAALALQSMCGFIVAKLVCSRQRRVATAGTTLLVVFVAAGLLSCWSMLCCQTWWPDWSDRDYKAIAIINQSKTTPIVMGWRKEMAWRAQMVTLARVLRPDAVLAFSSSDDLLPIPAGSTDVFLWYSSPEQRKQISAAGDISVQKTKAWCLWRLVREKHTDVSAQKGLLTAPFSSVATPPQKQ